MITKPILIVLCLLIAVPVQAGGFLADAIIRPVDAAAANALDQAHQSIGRSLDRKAQDFSPIIGQSKTCVTPRGSCEFSNSALSGTTCFCGDNKDLLFGRIQ